ncbi:putative galactose oxidase/kelch, beta-propeller, galactose oxidase, central domain superfamily [Septoria linicola]|nr:putative galactose oxidase/kelch, beta-propeller, galactose oxidase, central domain superfamily [Septoria linicola]
MALISIALLLTSASAVVAQNVGRWSSTIRFPVVPVAAAPLPGTNGQILVWSAFNPTEFESGKGRTQTAIFNPATGGITQRTVNNTRHDTFCPGISFDFNGNLMVTGGNDASRSSIYSTQQRAWISTPDMRTPRGY